MFGNWNNASLSGLRCRNMNNIRSNSNNNVGGRDYNINLKTFYKYSGVIGI